MTKMIRLLSLRVKVVRGTLLVFIRFLYKDTEKLTVFYLFINHFFNDANNKNESEKIAKVDLLELTVVLWC